MSAFHTTSIVPTCSNKMKRMVIGLCWDCMNATSNPEPRYDPIAPNACHLACERGRALWAMCNARGLEIVPFALCPPCLHLTISSARVYIYLSILHPLPLFKPCLSLLGLYTLLEPYRLSSPSGLHLTTFLSLTGSLDLFSFSLPFLLYYLSISRTKIPGSISRST